jgi:hypothetical protein
MQVGAVTSCLEKLSPDDRSARLRSRRMDIFLEGRDYLQKSIGNLLWRCSERVLAEQ